jgi:hypothetical protein
MQIRCERQAQRGQKVSGRSGPVRRCTIVLKYPRIRTVLHIRGLRNATVMDYQLTLVSVEMVLYFHEARLEIFRDCPPHDNLDGMQLDLS